MMWKANTVSFLLNKNFSTARVNLLLRCTAADFPYQIWKKNLILNSNLYKTLCGKTNWPEYFLFLAATKQL